MQKHLSALEWDIGNKPVDRHPNRKSQSLCGIAADTHPSPHLNLWREQPCQIEHLPHSDSCPACPGNRRSGCPSYQHRRRGCGFGWLSSIRSLPGGNRRRESSAELGTVSFKGRLADLLAPVKCMTVKHEIGFGEPKKMKEQDSVDAWENGDAHYLGW